MRSLAFLALWVGFWVGLNVGYLVPHPHSIHWQFVVIFAVLMLGVLALNVHYEVKIQRTKQNISFYKGKLATLNDLKEHMEKNGRAN